ncbi:acyl-CoA dehydrogenase [Amycolatopsis sp. GA6-003]|uniref:acyl-CoA dehydrogenase n=1 Tax=Amycolatopsis sp. GA6-003 TaxID=2652444 RepID=UPI003916F7CE
MVTSDRRFREEIVDRANAVVPVLRDNSSWSEENRRLSTEAIAALAGAGLFRLRHPKRFGGYEAGARTLVDVAAVLGRADGAAAWVTSVYWIPGWMASMFPDEVQEQVFADPDARVCGTLSPSAMSAPADGGIVVNGKWGFISGALHAGWQEIISVHVPEEGPPHPVVALVPMTDLLVVDDWQTSGMRGSGSVSTVAKDLFVPSERVLPLATVLEGNPVSPVSAASPIYRTPLLPVASASSVGAVLGLGRAAMDAFLARLPGRKITYTGYESQSAAPLTHLQVAEAARKLDEAEFHAYRLADTVDRKTAGGSGWDLPERARVRADLGAAVRLVKEAVDVLATASGGSSVYSDVPIQRIQRDVHAVSLHALMHPDTNDELYGRILCGLEPDTLYL